MVANPPEPGCSASVAGGACLLALQYHALHGSTTIAHRASVHRVFGRLFRNSLVSDVRRHDPEYYPAGL